MSNANIEKLLAAQKIDKERQQLKQTLGKVKAEKDQAFQTINDAKDGLLKLEAEAKSLQENYQKLAKMVADTLKQVEKANASHSEDLSLYNELFSKLNSLEVQLSEIERRINQKTNTFKTTSVEVAKASAMLKTVSQKYENAEKTYSPEIKALEQQFKEKVQGVDAKLLAKYLEVHENKAGKNVVVPLTGDNRCQGCFMDVPVAIVNKIKNDGWATCDECGRIIYQA